MGYRTILVLNNDLQSEWENDPHLGKGIASSAAGHRGANIGNYGTVLQVAHADTQSLMVVDSLSAATLATATWVRGESNEEIDIKLLRAAADKLGYNLHKKPSKQY